MSNIPIGGYGASGVWIITQGYGGSARTFNIDTILQQIAIESAFDIDTYIRSFNTILFDIDTNVQQLQNIRHFIMDTDLYSVIESKLDIDTILQEAIQTSSFIIDLKLEAPTITYTETDPGTKTFTASSSGAWVNYDIFTNQGIPKGATVAIVAVNTATDSEYEAGVRTDASVINRRVDIHEAEPSAGVAVRFLATVDSSTGYIEVYAESNTDIRFDIIGYYEGATFTELWETYTITYGQRGNWVDKDPYTDHSIPKGSVMHVLLQHEGDTYQALLGVRTDASSLERDEMLHEAEDGGANFIDMHVKSSVADGIIEIKLNNDNDNVAIITGYWDDSVDYVEKHVDQEPNIASWTTKDLTSELDEDGRIVEFTMVHADTGNPSYIGLRGGDSSVNRYIQIHESESNRGTGYSMSANSNASGEVDIYCTVSAEYMTLVGYFKEGKVTNYFFFDVDSLLQKVGEEVSFTIDTKLATEETQEILFDIDTLLSSPETTTFDIDTIVELLGTEAYDIDTIVYAILQQAFDIDLVVQETNILSLFDIDAVVYKRGVYGFDLDTIVYDRVEKPYDIDAILRGTINKLIDIDVLVQKIGIEEAFDADVIVVLPSQTEAYDIDVTLYKRILSLYDIDTVLYKRTETGFNIDSIVYKRDESSFSIDADLYKRLTSLFDIDTLVTLYFEKLFNIDVLLEWVGNTESIDIDAILFKIQSGPYDIDTTLYQRIEESFDADLTVYKLGQNQFDIDNIIYLRDEKALDIDLLTLKQFNSLYNIDLLAQKVGIPLTFNVDTDISSPSRPTQSFNMDVRVIRSYRGNLRGEVSVLSPYGDESVLGDRVYQGETATIEIVWRDRNDVETDPGACTITIWDEDDTAKVTAQPGAKVGGTTSTYIYQYSVPTDAVPTKKRSVVYSFVWYATVAGDSARQPGRLPIYKER